MATPRGAEHRDLEQRFRDLERKYDALASRVLMQRKAEVTQGDFVVKGGGNIVIQDAGGHTVWDALSGPLRVETQEGTLSNFAVPAAFTDIIVVNFTAPPGYTQLLVFVGVSVSCRNSGPNTQDYFEANITGARTDVQKGWLGTVAGSDTRLFTGLAAGAVTQIKLGIHAGNAWPADGWNAANLSAMGLWMR